MKILIPLRFVETHSSNDEDAFHSEAHLNSSVERANKIWIDTGIEFWVKSIERYHMPHLNKYVRDKDTAGCPNGAYCFTWADVRNELSQVFSTMPTNAYPESDHKSAGYWLHAASALYGDPNEILVWLVDESGSSGNAGPSTGRMVYIRRNGIWSDEIGGANTTLAHEIGHFMGLNHNNDVSLPVGYDNRARWDLVFLPGNPNVFFSSKDDPKCDPGKVQYIANKMTITTDTSFGPVHAEINNQSYVANGGDVDVELKGLIRPTGETHNPPNSWGFEMNVMGHLSTNEFEINGWVPRFFSKSQVDMISDFITRDVDYTTANKDLWLTSAGKLPNGAITGSLTSLRTRLGREFKGKIIGPPVATTWGTDRLDVFVRSDADHLWHKRYSGDKGWSYWRDLGGRLTSAPSVVSWGEGRLDVFARGHDGQLAHIRYSNDKGWSEWRDLGGRLTSEPTAVTWGEGRLDVFVKGFENQLAHKRYSEDKGWSEWRDLGGRLTSPPVAVSWGPGRLDIFAKGFENQLAHKRYDLEKEWSEWRDLGGRLTSPPVAVSWGPGRLDVFAKGFDNQLAHIRYSLDKGWSEWRDLGGRLTSPPSVASWGSGRLDVFVSGFENQLAQIRYSNDKEWSEWRDLGGRLTSTPTVVSWGQNRLDVFVRGFNEQPAHQRYSSDLNWSGWRNI